MFFKITDKLRFDIVYQICCFFHFWAFLFLLNFCSAVFNVRMLTVRIWLDLMSVNKFSTKTKVFNFTNDSIWINFIILSFLFIKRNAHFVHQQHNTDTLFLNQAFIFKLETQPSFNSTTTCNTCHPFNFKLVHNN